MQQALGHCGWKGASKLQLAEDACATLAFRIRLWKQEMKEQQSWSVIILINNNNKNPLTQSFFQLWLCLIHCLKALLLQLGPCTSYWTEEASAGIPTYHRQHCWREDCGESGDKTEAGLNSYTARYCVMRVLWLKCCLFVWRILILDEINTPIPLHMGAGTTFCLWKQGRTEVTFPSNGSPTSILGCHFRGFSTVLGAGSCCSERAFGPQAHRVRGGIVWERVLGVGRVLCSCIYKTKLLIPVQAFFINIFMSLLFLQKTKQ